MDKRTKTPAPAPSTEEPPTKKRRQEGEKAAAPAPVVAKAPNKAPPARVDKYPVGPVRCPDGIIATRKKGEEDLDDDSVVAVRRGEQDGKGGNMAEARAMAINVVWTEDHADVVNSLRPGKLILRVVQQLAFAELGRRIRKCIDPEEAWQLLHTAKWRQPSCGKELLGKLPVDRLLPWPVYYAQHWVLALIDSRGPRFDVLDTARTYAHGHREQALTGISRALRLAWQINLPAVLKHTDQQEGGSNDCGLWTIRNMMVHMKAALGDPMTAEEQDAVTREWLIKCWEQKDTGVLPQLLKPKKAAKKAVKKKKQSIKLSMKRERRSGPTPAA